MAKPLQLDPKQSEATVQIVATRGIGAPVVFDLTPDSTIIVGNSATCGILVDEPGISPIQCMLALHSNEPELQPWPTASGTLFNGQEVTSRTPLKNGDVIKIGECVLKVECGDSVGGARDFAELTEEVAATFPEPVEKAAPPLEAAHDEPPAASDSPAAAGSVATDETPGLDSASEDSDSLPSTADSTTADNSQANPHTNEDAEEAATDDAAKFDPYDEPQPRTPSFARSEPVFKWDEDAEDDETVSILKSEIVELQSEIAERDAQLEELLATQSNDSFSAREDISDDDSLIARVDELLLELNESDERMSILETMLSASETANRAEQEERRQLESWVGDIEKRIGENDAVREAEFGLLRNRLEEITEERDKAESQLAASARSNGAKQEHENLLKRLREENAALQQQLQELDGQRKSLEDQLNSVEVRNTQEAQQEFVDQAIREERARISRQQAELARERAELASKLADINRDADREDGSGKVDARVQALREHLKEIHQQEGGRRAPISEDNGGLMSRITSLWNKLDG